jgi:hypothetical protein
LGSAGNLAESDHPKNNQSRRLFAHIALYKAPRRKLFLIEIFDSFSPLQKFQIRQRAGYLY